jgi:membrane associated rhomboid family serine protease
MVLPLGDLEKTRIVPVVTYVLIALNVVTYLAQRDRGEAFTVAYAATPYEITHNEDLAEPTLLDELPPVVGGGDDPFGLPARPAMRPRVVHQAPGPYPIWLTLLTSMFLHGSPLHLASNMLFLWIFGDNVEEVLGGLRYLVVYLACGVAGSLFQIAANPDSLIPTLGASGAIAGVMGAYVIWFPHNRVRVLVLRFITEMPAVLVVGVWLAMQLWEGLGSLGHLGEVGGVAYLAHVGGAMTGIVVAWLFRDRAAFQRAMNDAQAGWFEGPDDGVQ